MAYTPKFTGVAKDDEPINRNSDESDRVLQEVDRENEKYYLEQAEIARNITRIKTGVKASTTASLKRKAGAANDNEVDILATERVQNELYKAVEGNEVYEEDKIYGSGRDAHGRPLGPDYVDNKNRKNSLSTEYFRSGFWAKRGMNARKYARGLWAGIGGKNLAESEVARRFGDIKEQKTVNERVRFTAMRMQPVLEDFLNRLPLFYDQIVMALGCGNRVDQVIEALAHADRQTLLNLRVITRQGSNEQPLLDNAIFEDLLLIKDLAARENAKAGMESVYDPERLHDFFNGIRFADSVAANVAPPNGVSVNFSNGFINPKKELGEAFEEIIKRYSMWPLHKHPEGQALMAQLEFRLRSIKIDPKYQNYLGSVIGLSPLQVNEFARALTLRDELLSIDQETPFQIDKSEEERRKEVNELQKTVLEDGNKIDSSYNSLIGLKDAIDKVRIDESAVLATINGMTATNTPAYNSASELHKKLIKDRKKLEETFEEEFNKLHKLESDFKQDVIKLKLALETMKRDSSKKISFIDDVLKATPTIRTDITGVGLAAGPAGVDKLHSSLYGKSADFWLNFQSQIDDSQGELYRLTPFQLLQRMLRREYLERRDPEHDPKHFHERAARYSLLNAAMRVQEVKNVDLYRHGNKKVAEYLKQGRLGRLERAGDRIASSANAAGHAIGIELIEGDRKSADSVLEQIIQYKEAQFGVFRGINKYTTPRDLRKILYERTEQVPQEVMEEFIAILEGVLEGVKTGDKGRTLLIHGDWDLESLIVNLQRFKLERWSQNYIDKVVKADGNKEYVMLEMIKEQREEEEKINKEIHSRVKSPDAMWKKQLSKNSIKQILNEEMTGAREKIKGVGMDKKKKDIERLEKQMEGLEDSDARKIALKREVENLRDSIRITEKEIGESRDLLDRTKEFKKVLEEKDLSRREAKMLAAEMGIAQVYDKMGMNFRLERYWKKIKKGAEWTLDKGKKGWNWSRAKFLNGDTARKTFSLARVGATPLTYPAGVAWKVGTFPFRLVGRAASGVVGIPGGIWRSLSASSMRAYVRERTFQLNERIAKLNAKKAILNADMAKVPYGWDKTRLRKRIYDLDDQIADLNTEIASLGARLSKLKPQTT